MRNETGKDTTSRLAWGPDVTILTNLRVWGDITRVWLIVVTCFVLLLGIPLGAAGDWQTVGMFALFAVALTSGLLIVGVLLLTIITGNRFRLHYDLGERGVICTATDLLGRMVSRGTLLAGLAAGSMAATGAGLAILASEERTALWSRIHRATFQPRRRSIDSRGSWRSLLVLYCPKDLYREIAQRVAQELDQAGSAGARRLGRSLAGLLAWSVAVIVACLALFGLPYPFEISLLIPMLLLAFSVASVWFLPFLGYAVLLGVAGAVFHILLVGMQTIEGLKFTGFESLNEVEWIPLYFAGLGLAFMTWFGVQTIRGRRPSAMHHDITEPQEAGSGKTGG